MMFLQKIDELHQDSRRKYTIPLENKNFSSFIPISLVCGDISYRYLIKKAEKAKLLITCGKQRIYLSDIQIINTILTMPNDDIIWFLKQFVMFYKGNSEKITIRIDGEEYIGCGISLYMADKDLHLFSDSIIKYNDFVMLLNFILSKDVCWGKIIDEPEFYKATLRKYISLIDYYHNKAERSKSYLLSVSYPIANRTPTDRYSRNKPIVFSPEGFDISKYL